MMGYQHQHSYLESLGHACTRETESEDVCRGKAGTVQFFQQGPGSDSAMTYKQHNTTILSSRRYFRAERCSCDASLGRTAHILSYVMLGKAECRPWKPEVFILFMWLHSQLWHCKWRKGRGKGCFFSKIQTQRYYPSTDFNLSSQILMYN